MMFDHDEYQLVDFGLGKKLERFSGVHVLRECPAANGFQPQAADRFRSGQILSFNRDKRRWTNLALVPKNDWSVRHGSVVLGLRPTPFGHLGVFSEQAANWSWLDSIGSSIAGRRAINLFAYTGGTTLKLASLGASVVHVDSSKSVVTWARENSRLSGLADRPIRWIIDDAMTFVGREIKRGNKYDIIVADPPAFGHGAKRASWKLGRDLPRLVKGLTEICDARPTAVLFSWHSAGVDARQLGEWLQRAFRLAAAGSTETGALDLLTPDGRKLNCGHFFRWHSSRLGSNGKR